MPCDSGIPDYRGPNGLWRKDPEAEKLVTYEYYMGDPEIRRRSQPAAGLAGVAADHGARLVIVNAEPTPDDERGGDEIVREPIGTALPKLLAGLRAG